MKQEKRYWAVVPAAGVGKRMGAEVPKQYLQLNGKTILEHTVIRIARHPRIEAVVVVTSKEDDAFSRLSWPSDCKVFNTYGGAERCHSVLNGLHFIEPHGGVDDWVLVHDAARPCILERDISRLIDQANEQGGILALPMADTVKRADTQQRICETVDRSTLWRALTPQMFPLQALAKALHHAINNDFLVTDEASAMEYAGVRPQLVEGEASNIKITTPSDLDYAAFVMQQQEKLA